SNAIFYRPADHPAQAIRRGLHDGADDGCGRMILCVLLGAASAVSAQLMAGVFGAFKWKPAPGDFATPSGISFAATNVPGRETRWYFAGQGHRHARPPAVTQQYWIWRGQQLRPAHYFTFSTIAAPG